MHRPTGWHLRGHFAALEGPRQQAKVLCPLPELLLCLLCGTLVGADDVSKIALWGEENLAFLRRSPPCRHSTPGHDVPGDVIAALDPARFKRCFVSWIEGLHEAAPDPVAIDGETSRPAHARGKGREPPPRFGLGQPSAPGARSGGGEQQVERDHHHPLAGGAPGAPGQPGHHRSMGTRSTFGETSRRLWR